MLLATKTKISEIFIHLESFETLLQDVRLVIFGHTLYKEVHGHDT